MCCHVEVSTTGRLLAQRSPTVCGVSECDLEAPITKRLRPTRGCCTTKKDLPYTQESYLKIISWHHVEPLRIFWRDFPPYAHKDQIYGSVVICGLHKGTMTINTLRTGDADLRFYITTVQDGWLKSAFLTRTCFPCTIHLIMQYIEPVSEWSCWPHSE